MFWFESRSSLSCTPTRVPVSRARRLEMFIPLASHSHFRLIQIGYFSRCIFRFALTLVELIVLPP